MKSYILPTCLLAAILISCQSKQTEQKEEQKEKVTITRDFEIQGHRGARGLYPENSIMGFIMAVDMGVDALELDVVISKDKKIVVSHEPWMSEEICKTSAGEPISEEQSMEYNIYEMTYDEIRQFDCGTKDHPRFPDQIKAPSYKPLLKFAVEVVETYTEAHYMEPVKYNIETKSLPEGDGIYHPEPKEFCELLYEELDSLGILDRTIIQSFDVRTLQEFRRTHPKITLALLVENHDSFEDNIKKLGFEPQIYSPYFKLVDEELITTCKERGIEVLPWCPNTEEEIKEMIDLGVDGIITDYPDIALTMRD